VIAPIIREPAPDFEGPEREPWMADALCAETDLNAFFPEKGGSTKAARGVCQRCDVQAECLSYALEHDERYGIWGGASPRERAAMKRRRES